MEKEDRTSNGPHADSSDGSAAQALWKSEHDTFVPFMHGFVLTVACYGSKCFERPLNAVQKPTSSSDGPKPAMSLNSRHLARS